MTTKISTHAPRTGSDPRSSLSFDTTWEFQPTLPARGATATEVVCTIAEGDFNPRSPHGERPCGIRSVHRNLPISTHAPRTGSDRGRFLFSPEKKISTHAPRTGSDRLRGFSPALPSYFNPRSPHGERPSRRSHGRTPAHFNPRSPHGERRPSADSTPPDSRFQPTLPARGATERVPRQLLRL